MDPEVCAAFNPTKKPKNDHYGSRMPGDRAELGRLFQHVRRAPILNSSSQPRGQCTRIHGQLYHVATASKYAHETTNWYKPSGKTLGFGLRGTGGAVIVRRCGADG
jgi:hypothetical protein